MSDLMSQFETLPEDTKTVLDWEWAQFKPYAEALLNHELTSRTLDDWLEASTRFTALAGEMGTRLYNATNVNTVDETAEKRYHRYLDDVSPHISQFRDKLNRKLLDSELQPENFSVPLRKIRTQVALFREENIPLNTEESKLGNVYYAIRGKQVVDWDGEEKTLAQLRPYQRDPERATREKAWRLTTQSYQDHRDEFDEVWRKLMDLRKQIAQNAGYDDYRGYIWQEKLRFDYTPEDALALCDAVEAVVVPALERRNEKQRQQLGVDRLRPWDAMVDPFGREPLKPFEDVDTMMEQSQVIFDKVDRSIGEYYKTLRDENLLDLDNRKNKGPGGYHTSLSNAKRSFIFANAVGLHSDFNTLVHEIGHAYHAYLKFQLPYLPQWNTPMEFNEVASMSLELLITPYLAESEGGFYSDADAARARIEHLSGIFRTWVMLARGIRFQHWIYTHHEEATNPAACDEKWLELTQRFVKGVDHSGLEDDIRADWRGTLHFFVVPFYLIEYAMARMGSIQIWANYLQDKETGFAKYRDSLALGGTAGLADLFSAAGAKFDFSESTFQQAVDLIEKTIGELEAAHPA